MRLFFLGFIILFSMAACQQSAVKQVYSPDRYEADFKKLIGSKELNDGELYLLDYTIKRQRPYFNYEVEGKPFSELMDMARGFEKSGMPVKDYFEAAPTQDYLSTEIKNEGGGFVRKGTSSRMKKMFRFGCTYENISDQDVVIQNSTFILNGPFGDHLSTVAYELNCLIPKGEKLYAYFLADAQNIQDNLLKGGNGQRLFFPMDSLLNDLSIRTGGHTVVTNTTYYKPCNFDEARISPFKEYELPTPLPTRQENGQTVIDRGSAHYPIEESDEPINM